MTIEEIYKLIEEIETTNKEYEKVIQDRKNNLTKKRKKAVLLRKIRIILTCCSLSAPGIFSLSNYIFNATNNIYNGNKLKITKLEKEQIKTKIEEELNITIQEENTEYDLLINALLENDNLTEQQKKLYGKDLLKIIESNPYIQKEITYLSLRKLDIIYKERPSDVAKEVMGKYNYTNFLNYIKPIIYIYDDKQQNTVLEHELVHCVLMNLENEDFPRFLKEGLTEIITMENFSDNPYISINCYPYEIITTKLLCDILTKETVLKSYTIGDMNIIYKELENTTTNINAKDFIKRIEKTVNQFNKYQKNFPKDIYQLETDFITYFILSQKEKDYPTFISNLELFKTLMEENSYQKYLDKIEKGEYTKKTYFKDNESSSKIKKYTK